MQTAIFPMKVLRFSSITSGAHAKCRNGKPSDKPVDLVGADTGRDWFYAFADLVCLRVYGKASHGLWFRTVDKVNTPSGAKYVYFLAEHMSVSGFKVGKVYKKGEKLFTEGRYGNASGNHLHVTFAISDNKVALGSGWRKNNRGAWVLYIPGTTNVEINKALFLDPNFTTRVMDYRLAFSKVNNDVKNEVKYEVGKTYTLLDDMNVRIGHSTASARVPVSKMTANARDHANDKGELEKGTRVTAKDVYHDIERGQWWVKTPSGWICAWTTTKVYMK